MFEDKGSPCKLFVFDVENLKVEEIKKRLKALRLPVTGNKSELVKRLQEAMISGKESQVESSSMEISVMAGDNADDSSANKLSDQILEGDMSSPLKEKDLSQETQDQTVSSAAAPVPLKKRAVVQTAADETVKPKKRFVLNRNNVPTPKLFVLDEPLKVESLIKIDVEKNEETRAMESGDKMLRKSGFIKHSLATQPKKVLSLAQRLVIRAKRSNLKMKAPKPRQRTMDPAKRQRIIEWLANVENDCAIPENSSSITGTFPEGDVINYEVESPNSPDDFMDFSLFEELDDKFIEDIDSYSNELEVYVIPTEPSSSQTTTRNLQLIEQEETKKIIGHDIDVIKAPGSDEQEKKIMRTGGV